MPRPRGCHECRSKRIKCDKVVPACGRCTNSGKICPGYEPSSELVFRDMSQYAEKKVKGRVGSRVYADSEASNTTTSPSSDSWMSVPTSEYHALTIGSRNGITPPPSTNFRDTAIPRLFFDYKTSSKALPLGNYSVLEDIANSSDSTPCLQQAMQAVALQHLANQVKDNSLEIEAAKYYSNAVSLMIEILGNPVEARKDSTLATSVFFGLYNLIHGYEMPDGFWVHFHFKGRLSLLRLRGDEQLQSRTGQMLWAITYIVHVMKCISSNIRPPDEAEKWLELVDGEVLSRQSVLSTINLKTARLCAEAQDLFDMKDQDELWLIGLLNIIKAGIELDRQYQTWSETPEDYWLYQVVRSSYPNNPARPHHHIYYDTTVGFIWNNFRSVRIHLHEILLHCCTLIEAQPSGQPMLSAFEETRRESSIVIQDMITDICASIPFCLGLIDRGGRATTERPQSIEGYRCMYPLYLAMVSAKEGGEIQTWIRDKLEWISAAMGIRLAMILARRPKRDPWNIR
ncbi:hypothetical protein BGZ60DRAFT_145751 [Tricladium varicosporioides]|nr:hypothetical protein BGZ60DRAFT_145751 [Hymenoscyphus varicosporioides]